jgi:hypothetical protein
MWHLRIAGPVLLCLYLNLMCIDKIYDTGNIHDSIIPVLYQSTVTVTCIHKVRLYYSITYNAIPKVSTRINKGLREPLISLMS